MSELKRPAPTAPKSTMYLDERLPDGHIVVCRGGGTEHSFLRRRLGLSVECPICGQMALSVDLVADFYRRSLGDFPAPAAMPEPAPTADRDAPMRAPGG
jgi:hypothetical protein